jgi:hypothetical protein
MTWEATSRFVPLAQAMAIHSTDLPPPFLQKLRDRQLAAPADSETIQALVKNELATKKHVATEGLLWLVRCVSIIETPIPRGLP